MKIAFSTSGADLSAPLDTRFGRVGLLICEDFWHASLPYLLWQDGADTLIFISASLEHGLGDAVSTAGKVLAITTAYALQFTTFVVHNFNFIGCANGLTRAVQ